ncbi:MAG: DnaJ C-terminal domain-containing protein [Lachnospiraceae bacterium]
MKRDYYQVLGVDKTADAQTIKKAYRKLAKKYHPDSNKGNAQAEERFKEATEAYNVLSDEAKRKLYDQFGHAAFDGSGEAYEQYQNGHGSNPFGGYQGFQGSPGSGYQEYHFESGEDMDDILKNLFGGGSGFFHSGRSRSQNRGFQQGFRSKGTDFKADLEVEFDEAAFGGKKRIQLQDEHGMTRTLEVTIPAGISSGKSIRLKGKGNPGIGGGEAGDLLLTISVKEKPGFQRKGQDVYTTVRIPFSTAVLGGEVKIQTIYGDVMCKIKEGTQSGSKIRLKGKGIVEMGNPSVRGDQYAAVEIQVPRNLTPEAKQKLREFEQACSGIRNSHAA